MAKQIDITHSVWRALSQILSEAARVESEGMGGGVAFRPDLPFSPSDLLLAAAGMVIDKKRIPLSIDDEIALNFNLNPQGGKIIGMRVVIRERQGEY